MIVRLDERARAKRLLHQLYGWQLEHRIGNAAELVEAIAEGLREHGDEARADERRELVAWLAQRCASAPPCGHCAHCRLAAWARTRSTETAHA